jgi:hypothetical protein
MKSLRSLEFSVLVDMLATQTDKYLKMQSDGASEEEFAKCALSIKAIQSEIDSRKQTSSNTSTTDPKIILPEE